MFGKVDIHICEYIMTNKVTYYECFVFYPFFSMCKPEGSCRLQEVSCTLLEIPCFEAGVFLQHAGNFLWGQKWGGRKSPIWRHLRGHQKSGGICLIYLNMFVGSKIHICFFFLEIFSQTWNSSVTTLENSCSLQVISSRLHFIEMII